MARVIELEGYLTNAIREQRDRERQQFLFLFAGAYGAG